MRNSRNNKQTKDINRIKISLSSPEDMLEKSSGEVIKPETINYRTYNRKWSLFLKSFWSN